MLSSALRSRPAIDVNVAIMRTFVHLRELLTSHAELARRIDELEQKYDGNFAGGRTGCGIRAAGGAVLDSRQRLGQLNRDERQGSLHQSADPGHPR